jgi:zinc-binding alcohol dehydrogenase family protein
MKAIGYRQAGPITADEALVAFETDDPEPGARDLLVEVRGVSVNPVDVKLRAGRPPASPPGILGYDAAGVVRAVGSEVTLFRPGDAVYYAGDLTRPGTNAELHVVDERIVGRKPASLGFAEAAGMALTSITAWELLFDSLGLTEGGGEGESLLVIGGAGGVGSILVQLAKKLTKLTVIATASRPETRAWVEEMGADHVVNHRRPLDLEVAALGLQPRYVASLTHTGQHVSAIRELIAPRGRVALIDDPPALDIVPFKRKAVTLAWELMFTRPMFGTADLAVQHALLDRVADLIDDGTLVSTVRRHGGPLTVENLRAAHVLQESTSAIGKTVLDGIP